MHGGGDNIAGNKTYQFDGTDWTEISTNGPAPPQRRHALGRRARQGRLRPLQREQRRRNFTRSHGPSVQAGFASYGAGCSGLSLAPDNAPWNATTFSATCTGMNAASPIKLSIWGFAATAIPVTGILGAGAGCTLLNTADVIDVALSPATSSSSLFAIPADPALAGVEINLQAGEVDLTLDNLALSNGLTLTIGG